MHNQTNYLSSIQTKSLNDLRESLLRYALSQVEDIYRPLTYLWIQSQHPDLNEELIRLEKKINSCGLPLKEDEEFKNLLAEYIQWHRVAIKLYREHLSSLEKPEYQKLKRKPDRDPEGGDIQMALTHWKPKEAELPSEGATMGVLIECIDLGTIYQEKWEKDAHQIRLVWELDELMNDGQPFVIGKTYNLSLFKNGKNIAKLREDLEAWLGHEIKESELKEGFDFSKLLGLNCVMTITHSENNGKVYANIASIGAVPKGQNVLEPVNEPKFLDLDAFDQEIFDSLPTWVQDRIKESGEYQTLTAPRQDVAM